MKKIEDIRSRQQPFIKKQIEFIESLSKELLFPNPKIQSCIISGSVARGTYMPGDMDGAIDIILFVDNSNSFNGNSELGNDTDKAIPGHVIKFQNIHYQIKIYDSNYLARFNENNEAEKYAFFESKILFDKTDTLQSKIDELRQQSVEETKKLYLKALNYATYLINDYKVARWKRRDAVIQLNYNLNRSIEASIRCLFYLNGFYAPAEDRALYFSFSLPKLPDNYDNIFNALFLIKTMSLSSYIKREGLYKDTILEFLNDNKVIVFS